MKYLIKSVFLFFYLNLFLMAENCQDKIIEYNKNILNLKNNYYLKSKIKKNIDGDTICLLLMNKDNEISNLNENSCELPFKNLGYVKFDFLESFLFIQAFGGGNPQIFNLIRKIDGKSILNFEGFILDYDDKNEFFIYRDINNKTTNIFNVKDNINYDLKIDNLILKACNTKNIEKDDCLNSHEISNEYVKIYKITKEKVLIKVGLEYKTIILKKHKEI